jgi:carbon monoxide dehydrogenase subunit G
MLKLDSKTGIINGNQEVVYKYIADFRNFAHMLPSDRLRNLEISGDSLKFDIDGLGTLGLKVLEKQPFRQLVVKATEGSSADFTCWINVSASSGNTSQVNIALQANLNMFLEMMAKAPLQQVVDLIVDQLAAVKFEK